MARASIEDPIKIFRFQVSIGDVPVIGFSEISGLSRTTAVAKYREGGDNITEQKSAGLTEFPAITLRRGQIVSGDKSLLSLFVYNWVAQLGIVTDTAAIFANGYRRDLTITQYSTTNDVVRAWNIINAFPSEYKPMSDLKAQASENSFEEIKLEHEGWTLDPKFINVLGAKP